MSKGALATAYAERSDHHTMRNKLNIRSVQLIFSVFLFLTLAGLTGCQDRGEEFLEKELGQEETEASSDSGKVQISQAETENTEVTAAVRPFVSPEPVPQTIYVDICGAVASPGVYELSANSRVFQAIEKAGGYLPEAAVGYLNRARTLSDGQQIYVPTQEEVDSQIIPVTQDGAASDGATGNGQAASGSEGVSADGTSDGSRINLNTADVSQLTTLTGIGESKALAIIAYREENGPFTSIEDIKNVPGIKEGTYEKIKDKIATE